MTKAYNIFVVYTCDIGGCDVSILYIRVIVF